MAPSKGARRRAREAKSDKISHNDGTDGGKTEVAKHDVHGPGGCAAERLPENVDAEAKDIENNGLLDEEAYQMSVVSGTSRKKTTDERTKVKNAVITSSDENESKKISVCADLAQVEDRTEDSSGEEETVSQPASKPIMKSPSMLQTKGTSNGVTTDLPPLSIAACARHDDDDGFTSVGGSKKGKKKSKANNKAKEELATALTVRDGGTPLLLALWLTEESRKQLLCYSPPIFGGVHADHLTLQYLPSDRKLPSKENNISVGQRVKLLLYEAVSDDVVQASLAAIDFDLQKCCQNTHPHVTISVGLKGTAAMSDKMLGKINTDLEGKALEAEAVVGLSVKSGSADAKKVLIADDETYTVWKGARLKAIASGRS